ncbi:MAG: class I adenylate-forming enzyme family protein [Verrucomicrobiota bacterium]
MLYARWQQIASAHRQEVALVDLAADRRWTFQQLQNEAEKTNRAGGAVAFPQGLSTEFIVTVLQGWRREQVVCPLEEGQAPFVLSELPAGCVHLKSTSASTGRRRFVAFTGGQLAADADQIVATMGLRQDWPNLGVISLAHSYGFSNLVLPLLLHGIPLILARSPLPETLRQAATLFGAMTVPAVPALWRAWFEADAIAGNVSLAISAGAPLPIALEAAVYAERGLKLHNFYGASECGGIAYDRSDRPRTDGTSVGSAMTGVDLSVNADGCLEIFSRAVGLSYWPEPTPSLSPGRYQTSDLAEVIDGIVHLRGRQSDLINIAGRKVLPESIERALATHPLVADCLVFGVPSPDLDRAEIVVACVAARSETSPEALKQHLLQLLPAWQIPRDWWFLPGLVANERGKLSRREWRQKYLERAQPD